MIRLSFASHRTIVFLFILLSLFTLTLASSGDRNPTYQHCLKGCTTTYCDTSQAALPFYLRAFGWTCEGNCQYHCMHSFTDNMRPGSRWHQFYGKWPFYRLGPIQEPFSVFMSLGNLYVNLKGLSELKRRVREENKLRRWMEITGWAQVNTWLWSSVFHTRDTPLTERLDYFSATITVALSLIYALNRTLSLQTPLGTSRFVYPTVGIVVFTVLSHFTYLLSFPLGSFPYGYHIKFVLVLAVLHNLLWITWSLSFKFPYPAFAFGHLAITYPKPYPPQDPLQNRPREAMTPLVLVILTTLAMSFELLDFAPVFRFIDAHSVWHACTIPLALAWWTFFCTDATQLEGSLLGAKGVSGVGIAADEKMPFSGGTTNNGTSEPTRQPPYAQVAAHAPPSRRPKSPAPKVGVRED